MVMRNVCRRLDGKHLALLPHNRQKPQVNKPVRSKTQNDNNKTMRKQGGKDRTVSYDLARRDLVELMENAKNSGPIFFHVFCFQRARITCDLAPSSKIHRERVDTIN